MRKYYITYNPLLMDIILTEFLTRGDKQHFWEKLNRQFRDELTLNNDLANSLELIKNTLKQMLKPAEESEEESKKEPNIISIITGLQNIKVAIKDPAVEKLLEKAIQYSVLKNVMNQKKREKREKTWKKLLKVKFKKIPSIKILTMKN